MLRKALARFTGRRPDGDPPPRRWWPILIAGALALVASFLVTLWLTYPGGPTGPATKSVTRSLP